MAGEQKQTDISITPTSETIINEILSKDSAKYTESDRANLIALCDGLSSERLLFYYQHGRLRSLLTLQKNKAIAELVELDKFSLTTGRALPHLLIADADYDLTATPEQIAAYEMDDYNPAYQPYHGSAEDIFLAMPEDFTNSMLTAGTFFVEKVEAISDAPAHLHYKTLSRTGDIVDGEISSAELPALADMGSPLSEDNIQALQAVHLEAILRITAVKSNTFSIPKARRDAELVQKELCDAFSCIMVPAAVQRARLFKELLKEHKKIQYFQDQLDRINNGTPQSCWNPRMVGFLSQKSWLEHKIKTLENSYSTRLLEKKIDYFSGALNKFSYALYDSQQSNYPLSSLGSSRLALTYMARPDNSYRVNKSKSLSMTFSRNGSESQDDDDDFKVSSKILHKSRNYVTDFFRKLAWPFLALSRTVLSTIPCTSQSSAVQNLKDINFYYTRSEKFKVKTAKYWYDSNNPIKLLEGEYPTNGSHCELTSVQTLGKPRFT